MITLKLSDYQSSLLEWALSKHTTNQPDNLAGRQAKRVCRRLTKQFVKHRANTIHMEREDWPTISKALRPLGAAFSAGSDEARLYSLYTLLIRNYPMPSRHTGN